MSNPPARFTPLLSDSGNSVATRIRSRPHSKGLSSLDRRFSSLLQVLSRYSLFLPTARTSGFFVSIYWKSFSHNVKLASSARSSSSSMKALCATFS